MHGSYSYPLVALSIVVAVLASHAALQLIRQVALAPSRATSLGWLVGGAVAMGLGVWAMHFIGMLAYESPASVTYAPGLTALSVLIAMLASGLALWVNTLPRLTPMLLMTSGTIMGGGIATMHYTGMAAMQMHMPYRYDPLLFAVSIVVAVVAATAALWLGGFFLRQRRPNRIYQALAAGAMGLAIAGMHYIGMAAMEMMPLTTPIISPAGVGMNSGQNLWLALAIAIATLAVLGLALLAISAEQRMRRSRHYRSRLDGLLEYRTRELRHERDQVAVMLDSIDEGVISLDREGHIQHINPIAAELCGWDPSLARGRPWARILQLRHEGTLQSVASQLEGVLQRGEVVHMSSQTLLVARDGSECAVELKASPVRRRSGDVEGAVLVFRDISYRQAMIRRLNFQAHHDSLTGLHNRTAFDDSLTAALADGGFHQLLYLDLDFFKVVNDTCGHAAGDTVLRELSALMRAQVRETDVLARLGGDEFAVLLYRCSREQAIERAEALCAAVSAYRYYDEGRPFQLGVSIGVAPVESGVQASEVLRQADGACYMAKQSGRNQVHAYHDGDAGFERAQREVQWLPLLHEALENDRFTLYIQPIRSLSDATSKPYYEVLLRYVNDSGEHLAPAHFMATAERFGLMPEIDIWVVTQALQVLESDDGRIESDAVLAINLSGQSMGDLRMRDQLAALVTQSSVMPQRLCFEITETAAISNLAQAREFIYSMRRLGCSFALDDFGSGMSSFAYLKELPVNQLKIDGAFVRNLTRDSLDAAIVSAICGICAQMGIITVAEYVERLELIPALELIGVDFVQGYGIGRPHPIGAPLISITPRNNGPAASLQG
ncbi:EAL domain-containing protein [Cobetia sp. 4B]|uniref:bifunctional diguanylate cyclase/phosphodiesterase n=1 Tax=Cobetia sp. 4B TaxID=2758724 RepID=UPI001C057BCA|nr:EAL domain-containing protein [Cobetia sp. 4B]MBR9755989.1 EAL domain-containing protein [Gammaproteobacteria bacterium]QWN36815.1 EAL domain-containing protein [Cobetia sp. 4B]